MKRTRTTEIIIEADEISVARRAPISVLRRCEACMVDVEMIAPEIAAFLCGTTARNVYRLIESGAVHFIEMPTGELLICANSILSP